MLYSEQDMQGKRTAEELGECLMERVAPRICVIRTLFIGPISQLPFAMAPVTSVNYSGNYLSACNHRGAWWVIHTEKASRAHLHISTENEEKKRWRKKEEGNEAWNRKGQWGESEFERKLAMEMPVFFLMWFISIFYKATLIKVLARSEHQCKCASVSYKLIIKLKSRDTFFSRAYKRRFGRKQNLLICSLWIYMYVVVQPEHVCFVKFTFLVLFSIFFHTKLPYMVSYL